LEWVPTALAGRRESFESFELKLRKIFARGQSGVADHWVGGRGENDARAHQVAPQPPSADHQVSVIGVQNPKIDIFEMLPKIVWSTIS
jgi:hypothetical protein